EMTTVAQLAEIASAQPRVIRELRESMWVRRDPARLPEIHLGYDALSALIVRAGGAGEMGDGQVQSVRRWTRGGGRLAPLASAPGDHWRRWLDDDGGPAVSLAGAGWAATPPRILTLARRASVEAPASVSARAISLTEAGAAGGWSVSWGAQ